MLKAEMVRARRRGDELVLSGLKGAQRTRAEQLAELLLAEASAHRGRSRAALREAWQAIPNSPSDKKLVSGLAKLIEDAADFVGDAPIEPSELRRLVFSQAAQQRQTVPLGGSFSPAEVLGAIAEQHGLTPEQLTQCLYSDLKGEQLLAEPPRLTKEALLSRYEIAQVQAVLLRSVKVVATVLCREAAALRQLFHALKFRRLLFRVESVESGRHRITIDGPFSLFESVTKYGGSLALVLPKLLQCQELELLAELRWGKRREPLKFRFVHRGSAQRTHGEPRLTDEVRMLLEAFSGKESAWQATVADCIFEVPGVGLVVPDLLFSHRERRRQVFLEVLGFWSREAVFQRIDLVKNGLKAPFLFAASERLRVKSELLSESDSAALYLFKNSPNPRAVERHLDLLAAPV